MIGRITQAYRDGEWVRINFMDLKIGGRFRLFDLVVEEDGTSEAIVNALPYIEEDGVGTVSCDLVPNIEEVTCPEEV